MVIGISLSRSQSDPIRGITIMQFENKNAPPRIFCDFAGTSFAVKLSCKIMDQFHGSGDEQQQQICDLREKNVSFV
jgi:hypothetical protein